MFKVHYKDQSGISDIVMVSFDVFLMFLLLTLNIFYTFSVSIDDIEQENVCWYSSSCQEVKKFLFTMMKKKKLKKFLFTMMYNCFENIPYNAFVEFCSFYTKNYMFFWWLL